MEHQFTALIRRDKDGYVSRCLEIDVECHAKTWEEAKASLKKAVETYLKTTPTEKLDRIGNDFFMYRFVVES